MDNKVARDWLKAKLKQELRSRRMTYGELVRRLNEIGVPENEVNIRNKMSRGTFTATYFVQCLAILGVRSLEIDLLEYPDTAAGPSASEDSGRRVDRAAKRARIRLAWTHEPPSGACEYSEVPE